MIRNLKVLGLALAAVFAMSAMTASAASAQNGMLTSDGPFYLLGTDNAEGNHLTYPEVPSVTCPESHYTVEAVNSSNPLTSGASAMTVTPTYTNCEASNDLPVTVTMNGCDYVFHIGETTGAKEYALTADLVCGEGGPVEVHVYAGSGHSFTVCTIKFEEQSGLEGATATETGTNGALVEGTLKNIEASRSGLCGSNTTTEAEYDVSVSLKGVDETEEEDTHVSLSHE